MAAIAAADECTFAAVLVAAAYLVACCSFLLRRLVYFAVVIAAADAWNCAAVNVAANDSAAICGGVLTNVQRRLRRQTRGRLLGCVLWLFQRCLVEFVAALAAAAEL